MVVRGEQRLASQPRVVVDMLRDGARDCESVVCACAATDFVQHD